MNWYHEQNGISQGPFTPAEMTTLIHDGTLTSETLTWHTDLEEWQPLGTLKPEWLQPTKPAKPIAAQAPSLNPRPSSKPLAPSLQEPAPKKSWWKKIIGQ